MREHSTAVSNLTQKHYPVEVLLPEFYDGSPVLHDLEMFCDARVEISDAALLSFVLKYFYCYVNNGGFDERIDHADVSRLCEMFSRHRSLNEPGDDIEMMNYLRQWSFSLRMLGDITKTGHVLRSIINQPMSPALQGLDSYTGLDIGTGTGVLLIAQFIHGHRNGFDDVDLYGIEYDKIVGLQTYKLFKKLNLGEIIMGDARESKTYYDLLDKQIAFVSNETVSAMHQPLRREHFVTICTALFNTLGKNIKDATFFPEGLIAYCKEMNVSVLLAKNTGFQGPAEYRGFNLFPQGIIIEGNIVPLHLLGEDMQSMLTEWARQALPKRW